MYHPTRGGVRGGRDRKSCSFYRYFPKILFLSLFLGIESFSKSVKYWNWQFPLRDPISRIRSSIWCDGRFLQIGVLSFLFLFSMSWSYWTLELWCSQTSCLGVKKLMHIILIIYVWYWCLFVFYSWWPEFTWEDVKADKHRENYLGHSIKAPVGRWQKGIYFSSAFMKMSYFVFIILHLAWRQNIA